MKLHKAKRYLYIEFLVLFVVVGLVTSVYSKFKNSRTLPVDNIESVGKVDEKKMVYGKSHIANGYYYAEDLGIRFKISEELQRQSLISKVETNSDYEQIWLDFSTKYLTEATADCGLTNGALGSLWRGEGRYKQVPSSKLVKQFNKFFVAYNSGGYNCSFNSNDEIKTRHALAWEDFEKSFDTIEEINK